MSWKLKNISNFRQKFVKTVQVIYFKKLWLIKTLVDSKII